MATYGYARVSSSDQSTDTQVQRLKAAGCKVVRTEKISGKSRDGRDQLATLLEFIGRGDVLVCVKLDRLGRSTRDVLNLVHELDQKGANLCILEPAISTDGPMGKMVLTVLGMVAEMELGFIKARQRDGIERAKSKGDVYKGRKPTIDRSAVRDLFNEGIGASEIARRLSIGRASVYRVLEL
jgi:DNA invertase Pin-like site-specific DNA recombinase